MVSFVIVVLIHIILDLVLIHLVFFDNAVKLAVADPGSRNATARPLA
jgi:hypothetical protein